MAWRVWSKLCRAKKYLPLLCPFFILLLTISVMTVTLPFPSPPVEMDRRSSRVLSSAGEFRSSSYSRIRVNLPPAAHVADRLSQIHNREWKSSAAKKKQSVSLTPNEHDRRTKTEQEKRPTSVNRHKQKNEKTAGAMQNPARPQHGPQLPHFTANNTGPKHRIRPSDRSAVVKHTAETHIRAERRKFTTAQNSAQTQAVISDRQSARRQTGTRRDTHANRNADTQLHNRHKGSEPAEHQQDVGKNTQAPNHLDRIIQEQQAVNTPNRNLKKHQHFSEDPLHKNTMTKVEEVGEWGDGSRCQRLTEQDFPGDDNRRIRTSPDSQNHPWFSQDDIEKMELLAGGEVESKARVPAHGRVLQVALEPPHLKVTGSPQKHPDSPTESCQQGHCALIKRTDDWFEVFAFHLDRVLGLNRSLPAVLRTFHSEILPYRFTSGTPRPVVWWDPDIQHLTDTDNDQNSVPLSWVQYQQLLQLHCGSEADLRSEACVGVHHSEWERLALFDFLLQVNDRLDRYCCGFTPDPTEECVENLLQAKCRNTKELLLVHILVRKADPSRLVFIDNAGRPRQSADNLNFRLVEGIHEFPEKAVSVLRSGCLESLLLRSLYTDRQFWASRGGVGGLRPLIETVELRGKILLQHIRDRKLQLKRDL